MEVRATKLPPVHPSYTVVLENMTEREAQILRRIVGANMTIPEYCTRIWKDDYGHSEIYDFLAKISAGLDKSGISAITGTVSRYGGGK